MKIRQPIQLIQPIPMKIRQPFHSSTLICSTLFCQQSTLAEQTIDQVLPTAIAFRSTETWEGQLGARTDAQDQGNPAFSCCIHNPTPGLANAAARRGNNLAASAHFDEAIEQFSQAIAVLPSPRWLLSRAKLYVKAGRNEAARADLRLAIAGGPQEPGLQFEIENLLVKLGEYQLVEQTIPAILSWHADAPAIILGQFQYLLASAQEHLGDRSQALENYLSAATNFMIQGSSAPAAFCVQRANSIASLNSSTAPYEVGTLSPPREGLEQMKKMVAHLVSEPNLFQPPVVQAVTGATMSSSSQHQYFQTQSSQPLTGVSLVCLNDLPGVKQELQILTATRKCCLRLSDLDSVLAGCQRVDVPEFWNPQLVKAHAYKVASGTLVLSVYVGGFREAIDITVYGDGTPFRGEERPLNLSPQEEALGRSRKISQLLEADKKAQTLTATEQWLKQSPTDVDANSYRAQALAKAGKYEEALKNIDFVIAYADRTKDTRFINRDRGNWPLIQRGTYQVGLAKYTEALQDFKQAFPPTPQADDYYWRARAEIGVGDLQNACTDLQSAISGYFADARIVRRDETKKLLQETRQRM